MTERTSSNKGTIPNLTPEEVRRRAERWFETTQEDRDETIRLLQQNANDELHDEWEAYFRSRINDPWLNRKEITAIEAVGDKIRNNAELSLGKRRLLEETLSLFYTHFNMGIPLKDIRALNPYADDPDQLTSEIVGTLSKEFESLENSQFILKRTQVPFLLESGEQVELEVAKLVSINSTE